MNVYDTMVETVLGDELFLAAVAPRQEVVAKALKAYAASPMKKCRCFHVVNDLALAREKSSLGLLLADLHEWQRKEGNKDRLHLWHSLGVFLLGLSLASKDQQLRERLLRFPKNFNCQTTDGAHLYDSFFLRWLCASLYHDIGYLDLIAAKRGHLAKSHIIDDLFAIQRQPYDLPFDEELDLARYQAQGERPTDLFRLLAEVLKVQSTGPLAEIAAAESFLRTRNNVALEERFENELTPNHSVASATRMASAIFSHYQNGRRSRYVPPKEDLRLNWNRDLFYRDLMDAVLAVFLHNIVPWMSADELKNCGWCSPNDYPALTYLLLLCDVLVEWDKPKAHDGNPPMRGSDVRLEFDQAGSAKLFYPAAAVQKAAEVGDKLQNCFGPEFNHVRVEAGR